MAAKPKNNSAVQRKMGRPSTYTEEVGKEVCLRMALGETVVDIQKDECMPSQADIYRWRQIHPDFNAAYARAREDQMHTWADEIIALADDGTKDVLRDEDGKPVLKADGNPKMYREHIDRARLMIDTRKWLMAKVLPAVFGDRLQMDATHSIESKSDAELIHALQESARKAGMTPEDVVGLMNGKITFQ